MVALCLVQHLMKLTQSNHDNFLGFYVPDLFVTKEACFGDHLLIAYVTLKAVQISLLGSMQ